MTTHSIEIEDNKDGTISAEITCDICGQRLTHSDKWGIWCDKECGHEESKKAEKEIEKHVNALMDEMDKAEALFGDKP